jgi:hypothetical protein
MADPQPGNRWWITGWMRRLSAVVRQRTAALDPNAALRDE